MGTVRDILEIAADTIDKRASDRDLPQERSMDATVKAFNAIFGTSLIESQGWAFMQILKMVRARTGPYKQDDFVDGASYVALMGESREAEWKQTQLKSLAITVRDEATEIAANNS